VQSRHCVGVKFAGSSLESAFFPNIPESSLTFPGTGVIGGTWIKAQNGMPFADLQRQL
jgi:hypothetical protein